jgi:NNP family nitrate/nitrite transporter-like MFS transporter
MLSIPIFAGSLMRFPLGLLAQYIGRKNATLVEMVGIAIAMLYGYFAVDSFGDLLAAVDFAIQKDYPARGEYTGDI